MAKDSSSKTFKVKTPHAAVLVWNYSDRIGTPDGDYKSTGLKGNLNQIEKSSPPLIVSTLSCVSIQTQKSKSDPVGRFNLVLAPYKNWVGTLTAGSWCVIMMTNEKIDEQQLKNADPKYVKMLGRIETVRCETSMDESGTRRTLYYVSGVDWGHLFNSNLYIDNLISEPNDPGTLGNGAAVAIREALFAKNGMPQNFTVKQNLANLLDIMGRNLAGYTAAGKEIGRLGNSIYEFKIPKELADYFKFRGPDGSPINGDSINKLLSLKTGSLVSQDKYNDVAEAKGFIDPFSLQGTNTIWQILLENSNPALNEMFSDMAWTSDGGLQLCLYNRIRPFSYKGFKAKAGEKKQLKSFFQLVKYHDLDPLTIISVNAGTNWRDKFNFIEIKPQFQEFQVVANWYKQKAQVFDEVSFSREGFRPLIFDTKQFPSGSEQGGLPNDVGVDWSQLEVWAKLMREWYFGTHRMLNGTITMVGSTEYIGVGNNIRFPSDILNPTPNLNKKLAQQKKPEYILAHIENVSHSFTIKPDGAREYITTVDFVRGIIVSENNELVGEGMLDQFTDPSKGGMTDNEDRNTVNINSTSDKSDPDPQKVRGT